MVRRARERRSCPHHDRPDSAERERADHQPARLRALGPPRADPERPTTEQPTTEQPGPEQPTTEQPPEQARHRAAARAPDAGPAARGSTARATTASSAASAAASRRYFNIDPVLVRVGAVALVFLGGAGLIAYLAAVLLIPNEGEGGRPPDGPSRGMATIGAVLLVFAIGVVLPFHGGWWGGWSARAARVPRPCGPPRLAAGFRSSARRGRTRGPARHGARRRADRALRRARHHRRLGRRRAAATASWPGSSSRPASR